jgi:hypothetical protein
MSVIFLADVRKTTFLSTARKPASSYKNEKSGLPSMLGTYQIKTRGTRKPGGVADGRDVSAFDANDPRAPLAFRAEVYRRAPMVGFIAEGNDVAGIKSEYAEAIDDQMIEHKRDMNYECLSEQESSATGGLEGGSVQRGIFRWVNAGELAITDPNCPIPANARTPADQIFTGSIGDGINTGFTEAVARGLFKARWDRTGDSGELTFFGGSMIIDRFAMFSTYTPNVTGATPIVRTMTKEYDGGVFYSPNVDVYKAGPYGAWTLIPVTGDQIPSAYYGVGVDMSQVEVRSRYWCKEKPIPDLGGGPRELIESIIALIPGDLRSHMAVKATA